MAIPEVDNEFYPKPSEVLNQMLADLRFGFDVIGITKNIRPNSEAFIRAKSVADRVSIAIANNQISSNDFNPLDAEEEALERLAAVFGVFRREASQAAGFVIVGVTNGPIGIPGGFAATGPTGEGLEVVTGGAPAVSEGDVVELLSVEGGADQNIAAGKQVTWDSAAIGQLNPVAVVDVGGIDGGADEDNDDTLRRRLIQRLSFPQVGGNVAQVAAFAEAATAAIQVAFVFAAVRGPGSYDVAIVKKGGDRTLSTAIINLAAANIVANMPGHTRLNVTSVNAQEIDVVIEIGLPNPVNAGGAGGGFRDAVQWPSTAETGVNVLAEIIGLGPNSITVNSTTSDTPKAGQRFGIWDPDKDNGVDEDGVAEEPGG